MIDLSIVIPTCNRPELLRQGLERLRSDLKCSYEIIVVSGANDEQTPAVLEAAQKDFGDRLKVIRETRREGFVRAANKGFRAATGRNMIWLNDDARPLPGTLDEAVRQMDAADESVGFLAMFHRYNSRKNIAYQSERGDEVYSLCHVRGTLYANFPIGRRETYEALGYFDEQFYFYAADPDLSLKAWHAGLRIEPAYGCYIDHDEHQDDRRSEDAHRGQADNAKLFAKWNLPEKNLQRNDFDPRNPCTLRGLRSDLPGITFLIATHNRKTAVLNTLSQLQLLGSSRDFQAQTIVIDNASTDGTPNAIATQYPLVTLVRNSRNDGACAKNVGIPLATGEYIVFLDDDSYPDAASLRAMVAHFKADPRLGAAVFNVTLPDGSREASAFPSVCIGCGTGFRRETLQAAGRLPQDFFMQAEEYDLSLRILDAGYDVRRFDDLNVTHLKTSAARRPARTTRLDIRNNLLVITRNFPSRWVVPYAADWIRRYHWMASGRGAEHLFAFYRGLAEGLLKSLVPGRRRSISDGAFEKFARTDQIRGELARSVRRDDVQSILLIDVGKNLYAYWRAARELNLKIVAIADNGLAQPRRRYRGIPIVDDRAARQFSFDAAIVANDSPIAAPIRFNQWREGMDRTVIALNVAPPPSRLAA